MPKAICGRLHSILELELAQIKNLRFDVSSSNQRFLSQLNKDMDKAMVALKEFPSRISNI